ncbi:hypothetical protein C8F01DRAFT_1378775 [Mycena amicta]|nr:hypothetical protein C8F01DRAFT_1378775 [Mycena amicta]
MCRRRSFHSPCPNLLKDFAPSMIGYPACVRLSKRLRFPGRLRFSKTLSLFAAVSLSCAANEGSGQWVWFALADAESLINATHAPHWQRHPTQPFPSPLPRRPSHPCTLLLTLLLFASADLVTRPSSVDRWSRDTAACASIGSHREPVGRAETRWRRRTLVPIVASVAGSTSGDDGGAMGRYVAGRGCVYTCPLALRLSTYTSTTLRVSSTYSKPSPESYPRSTANSFRLLPLGGCAHREYTSRLCALLVHAGSADDNRAS